METNPIIVALDVQDVYKARKLVEVLWPHVGGFKIGLEFQMSQLAYLLSPETNDGDAEGRLGVLRSFFDEISSMVMWDGKFSDIPNTVGGAAQALKPVSPWGFTMHASAGKEAIAKAVELRGTSLVLGVTVLTSISTEECQSIFGADSETKVLQFAHDLVTQGAQGIVCSPKELTVLGQYSELDSLIRVIPGIRPLWAVKGDQSRVMTPAKAILAGANRLVIGRPITEPPAEVGSPADAAQRIMEEINGHQ